MEANAEAVFVVEGATPDRLAEVLRLTTALCDQVLDAQIMVRPVPDEQIRALVNAARLLREHDAEWPPLLTQVLHEIGANSLATGIGEGDPPTEDEGGRAPEGNKPNKLAWLLKPFQGHR